MNDTSALRVLLVEDSFDDVVLTRMAFNKSRVSAQLHVVSDGRKALEFLLEPREPDAMWPDLILLDLNLPKASGLEVLKELRARDEFSAIPIILLTSSGHREDMLQSYNLGCNAYIQKPSDFNVFVRAIDALGEHWSTNARLARRRK
ncbi:MAG: response regulator [Dehalococcoidia bacterium]